MAGTDSSFFLSVMALSDFSLLLSLYRLLATVFTKIHPFCICHNLILLSTTVEDRDNKLNHFYNDYLQ